MQFTFLVTDDEKLSRSFINDLIREFVPDAIVHEAANVKNALALLDETKPDIVFLDIKMPGADGFDFLEMAPGRDFELIFITAHSQYAIKAIKEGACDYLLKPIKKTEFRDAIEKAVNRRMKNLEMADIKELSPEPYLEKKLIINYQKGMRMVRLKDIVYLKADNTYTTLFLVNNEKVITTKPIHKFEKQLDPEYFFRIHKSYIINLAHFSEYTSRENNFVIMNDGSKLLISRYRLSQFLKVIKSPQ